VVTTWICAFAAVALAILLQHTVLATWLVAPDLVLAILAVALVELPLVPLVWTVAGLGIAADAIDPGSVWFHLITSLALMLVIVPVRVLLHRRRWTSWSIVGAAAPAFVYGADVAVTGWGRLDPWSLLAIIATTSCAAVATGGIVALWRMQPSPTGRTELVETAVTDRDALTLP
jgi:hypothetical protein